MKSFSEIRADVLKQVETEGGRDADRGDHRKPIRKRGYYRALKRNEPWALAQQNARFILNDISRQLFTAWTS